MRFDLLMFEVVRGCSALRPDRHFVFLVRDWPRVNALVVSWRRRYAAERGGGGGCGCSRPCFLEAVTVAAGIEQASWGSQGKYTHRVGTFIWYS